MSGDDDGAGRLDNLDVLLVPLPAGVLDALGVAGRAEVECVCIVAALQRARVILGRGTAVEP